MSIVKLHIKKNDMVKIIAGKEQGKTGKVLRVFPGKSPGCCRRSQHD